MVCERVQWPRTRTATHGQSWLASRKFGVRGHGAADFTAELHATAARELHPTFVELVQRTCEPFIQAIIDVVVPRMAFGRVCLLGDAAFVLRPHPAAATAKAAANATALADALIAKPDDPPVALRAWETQQLKHGRALADQAVAIGRRTVEVRTGSPTLSDVAERFRGVSPSLPMAQIA
jgi:2,6-dihydroxypyridine 3-monooxygenase